MAEYAFRTIEQKWQQRWEQQHTYRTDLDAARPKYYVLDMFPYPSGAGLHVGHPLGYIATDIVARYKRLRGFNVLHPMGFDSFGLPAEQYAIQTGQHPAVTTAQNIATYTAQLKQMGLGYDWSREVRTSDPEFYKWTQWIFGQLFDHYYDKDADKALPVSGLISRFAASGNAGLNAACDEDTPAFTAADWAAMPPAEQERMLLRYRLTMPEDSFVNWCAALGTVLSNDEVKDGVSERGGHPVERKRMKQWAMRITAYADRLLAGLDTVDWPDSIKEQQRNWIGRSQGASVVFRISDAGFRMSDVPRTEHPSEIPHPKSDIEVFTTRVDTIFGVSFLVLAPEHELVPHLTIPERRAEVEAYVKWAAGRSDVDRMAEVKRVTGVFTGSYARNPVNDAPVPVYIADYVLAGYGTGAVMGVPSGDQRDWNFATHFNLPILPILDTQRDLDKQADATKEGRYIHSGFINGLDYKAATDTLVQWLEARGLGRGKVQYRLRNAVFSRQRYWGEPVPVYYQDGLPRLLGEHELPLVLPEVDKYLPTETGEPPLGRAEGWKHAGGHDYELSTMPGWAGSSWYFYRYMDPHNAGAFASPEALAYWQDVDLYLGGSEHATGHLLYSRFWNHFLHDLGRVPHREYAKKLINQGMILGRSNFVYRINFSLSIYGADNDFHDVIWKSIPSVFVSKNLCDTLSKIDKIETEALLKNVSVEESIYAIPEYKNAISLYRNKIDEIETRLRETHKFDDLYLDKDRKCPASISEIHVDVTIVENDELDTGAFRNWRPEYRNAEFILEDGKYVCGWEVEKMSKSKHNVVNPDAIVARYGADTLRMYEMFLGPLTEAKPWNTNGISGVHNFLRKLWRLFFSESGQWLVADEPPVPSELKSLHKTIKKVAEDVENYSFNTSVSAFMICVNELTALGCRKRAVLTDLVVVLSPFAPHIAEELWEHLGQAGSVTRAAYPAFDPAHLAEDSFEYPVSINGRVRTKLSLPAGTPPAEIEQAVLADETVRKWLEGKPPKKVIVVPGRIVNLVV